MAKGRRRKKSKSRAKKLKRADYEAIMVDLNNKLAQLRRQVQRADDINFELKEKTQTVQADHKDVSGHLERTVAAKESTIRELEQTLDDLERLEGEEEAENAAAVKRLETKFVYELDRLTNEVELLKLRKKTWEEFKCEREHLLRKVESLKERAHHREQNYKKSVHELEERFVVQKKQLNVEVKYNLEHLTSDCMHSTQIRQAAYASRLLRENVKLQGMLQARIKVVMKLIRESEQSFENTKILEEEYDAMIQINDHLAAVAANKHTIMDKITRKFTKLKTRFVEHYRYKVIGREMSGKALRDRIDWPKMATNVDKLNAKMQSFKVELRAMVAEHDEHESEITRLNKFLQQIEGAVTLTSQSLRVLWKYKPRTPATGQRYDVTVAQQDDLLHEMRELLSKDRSLFPGTPLPSATAVYEPIYNLGDIGLVLAEPPPSESEPSAGSPSQGSVSEEEASVDPEADLIKFCPIIDVEWGSMLYDSADEEAAPHRDTVRGPVRVSRSVR